MLNFVCLTYSKKLWKIYFLACAFTLVPFSVSFFSLFTQVVLSFSMLPQYEIQPLSRFFHCSKLVWWFVIYLWLREAPHKRADFRSRNKVPGVKSIGRVQNCSSSFMFACKIKVLIILKMIQRHYQLKEQNWPVCGLGTVLLFNRF